MVPDRSQQTRADFSSNRPIVRADFGARQVVQTVVAPSAEPLGTAQQVAVETSMPVEPPLQAVAPATAPQRPLVPIPNQPLPFTPIVEDTPDLDSLLQAVGVQAQSPSSPAVPAKPPHPLKAWVESHRKSLKIGTAAAAVLFVALSGVGIYRGYTHNTPLVGIAAPTAVKLANSNDHVVVTAASFHEQSADAARQATINALYARVEAFYVSKGYYPSNTDMESLSWIAANFKGFDMTSLKDPDGLMVGLTGKPAKNAYAYQAAADTHMSQCDNSLINCNYYVLTATMSSGTPFTKVALQ